jgi:hypothetical protein
MAAFEAGSIKMRIDNGVPVYTCMHRPEARNTVIFIPFEILMSFTKQFSWLARPSKEELSSSKVEYPPPIRHIVAPR